MSCRKKQIKSLTMTVLGISETTIKSTTTLKHLLRMHQMTKKKVKMMALTILATLMIPNLRQVSNSLPIAILRLKKLTKKMMMILVTLETLMNQKTNLRVALNLANIKKNKTILETLMMSQPKNKSPNLLWMFKNTQHLDWRLKIRARSMGLMTFTLMDRPSRMSFTHLHSA